MNLSPEERVLVRGDAASETSSMLGWYPVVVREEGVWWRFFGEKRFSAPFFFDSVSALNREGGPCLKTDFDALDRFDDALAPDAFIFHISRCGSTLLSQLLAILPSCISMSEPTAIDSFLRLYHAQPEREGAENVLRNIVMALGQRRFAGERRFFVKLDSWHIGSLSLFRRAFPSTPFIFLYREPGAVLASHRRQRGRQVVPGLVNAAMPAFSPPALSPGDLDGYCASVLEYFFGEALLHAEELMLMNYNQLPSLFLQVMLDFFSISPSAEEIEAINARSRLHSKSAMKFSCDPEHGVSMPCAVLDSCYEKLEKLRRTSDPWRKAR